MTFEGKSRVLMRFFYLIASAITRFLTSVAGAAALCDFSKLLTMHQQTSLLRLILENKMSAGSPHHQNAMLEQLQSTNQLGKVSLNERRKEKGCYRNDFTGGKKTEILL